LKIVFAGGGTAGHINPALAIAGYVKLRQPDAEILYIGNKGGMEERLVAQAGYEFKSISIQGFSRKCNLADMTKDSWEKTLNSYEESFKLSKKYNPSFMVLHTDMYEREYEIDKELKNIHLKLIMEDDREKTMVYKCSR